MLSDLETRPPDPLLKLIRLFDEDPRPAKIDLGVGVYQDEAGRTPVMAAVKAAEARLLAEQDTKAYVGAAGDEGFVAALARLLFGELAQDLGHRLMGIQATGGTGALRLAADLAARAGAPGALLGAPSWTNHPPVLAAAGLPARWCDYFDPRTQSVTFAAVMEALEAGAAGELVVLQGCCHNPTGADFDLAQWRSMAEVIARRRLLPLIDIAYPGLGEGLDEDLAGVRLVLEQCPEAMVAVSGAKSFGLYRERVGALFVLASDEGGARRAVSNLLALARASYSMPPDHGAAVVRLILTTPDLAHAWWEELAVMRRRIADMRARLAAAATEAGVSLGAVADRKGMFTTLPLTGDEVLRLRAERAIFMTDAARINVAALNPARIATLVDALAELAPA